MFPRVSPALVAALIAAQSSLVFDFVSRQKIGGINMELFIWKQLPVPTPAMLEPHTGFLVPRVLELVYTAYDMTPLARDLGDDGAPFGWDEERRCADPRRAGCVLLPAVRDRAGRRGLHHGDVPDRERRTQAQRHRQVRLVPDQGDHPGVLRPDGGGRCCRDSRTRRRSRHLPGRVHGIRPEANRNSSPAERVGSSIGARSTT